MGLTEWAERWAIPAAALDELCRLSVFTPDEVVGEKVKSEALVQSEVRLEAARMGLYLFRNNVGAGKVADTGKFMRWGLGNDSPAVNKVLKSADLIGIRRRLITPADVGRYLGQFVSREVKRSDWKFSGTEDEHAQIQWATLVNAQGGDAKIISGVGSLQI